MANSGQKKQNMIQEEIGIVVQNGCIPNILYIIKYIIYRTPSLTALPTGSHDALVEEETLTFGNIILGTDGC